ncbi:MAG: ATP synthase F1 subunit gamma [Candidatus Omnitrophica bacterium]|nr:ATP synthase F1 subunit gamma [Candidatus Omnitrophota bacterium]
MLSLRQIKARIHSIENTEKLTAAMEMVSVSKLKPVQRALSSLREYSLAIEQTLNNLLASFGNESHPLLEERVKKENIALCVITSDTGLCGSYNNHVTRLAEDFIRKNSGRKIDLICVGRKALKHFRRTGLEAAFAYTDLYGRYSVERFETIARNLINLFLSGKADEVYVAYMHFESPTRYAPVLEKFLNMGISAGSGIEYIVEPDIHTILEELLWRYCLSKFKVIMLSAFASEHSARVIAMGEATDNADELLDDLVLLRNKVRQESITRELIEVISTVEALRG